MSFFPNTLYYYDKPYVFVFDRNSFKYINIYTVYSCNMALTIHYMISFSIDDGIFHDVGPICLFLSTERPPVRGHIHDNIQHVLLHGILRVAYDRIEVGRFFNFQPVFERFTKPLLRG